MKILVTGAAGFIGSALTQRLLDRGDVVLGLDSLNSYYDVGLKQARLNRLLPHSNFQFIKGDLTDFPLLQGLFERERPTHVANLAAQAGVRYSLSNPHAYVDSNIKGFLNILEACRHTEVDHLVYASSSSVYGANRSLPFSVRQDISHPVSLYGATKKANELMAHSYSHLFGLPTTGLRFFSVYGPWGRPDMALFLFTKNILEGVPIDVFNHGNHLRDFTYIDDIVEGLVCVIDKPATSASRWDPTQPDPGLSSAPYRVFNLGNHAPVVLEDMIHILETVLGKKAKKNYLPLQLGDVSQTSAEMGDFYEEFGFKPKVSLQEGIYRFAEWYIEFYGQEKNVTLASPDWVPVPDNNSTDRLSRSTH